VSGAANPNYTLTAGVSRGSYTIRAVYPLFQGRAGVFRPCRRCVVARRRHRWLEPDVGPTL